MGIINKMAPIIPAIQYSQKYRFLNILYSEKLYLLILIESEYSWESAADTKSSWRIGDGTASFYNYIYYNTAGFSEIDTFRSNQVREGLISRNQALSFSRQENVPRYENIKWYLKMIDIPFKPAIMAINKMEKLYN